MILVEHIAMSPSSPAGSRARAAARLDRMPQWPQPLVGRDNDLEAAEALIVSGTVRLLTITGPPGVGKTRFAVELASTVASEFDEGAVFVDLAPLRDPGLVLDAIAQAVGMGDHPDQPALQRLQRHLRDRHVLLVLDNLEHVIAAAADLAQLLAAGPQGKLLVTSRQPLHVAWEHRYNLVPLTVPDATSDQAALTRTPATALFLQRANAAGAKLPLNERNAAAVAGICRRLDGLPLAIELAAAWTGALGPEAILSRLTDHQGLPLHGSCDVPERQRSLVEAIAWSYDLLNESERRVFRALGAFAGEIPLEAVESVCEELGVDILTPVAGLVDKNLVVRVGDGEPRFRMLQTIHEFAEERLEAAGEGDAVRRRHAAWFLDLARQAERFVWSERQAVWLERVERVHDNIRGALQWCLNGGDQETGVLLAASMHRFWFARGYVREGRRWDELAASKQGVSAGGHALALRNLAFFLMNEGEAEEAVRLAEEAVALARPVGEPALMAWILHGLALATAAANDLERSERVNREVLEIARRVGDEALTARALCGIGNARRIRGDYAAARVVLEEALALARPRHDKWLASTVTGDLALALAPADRGQAAALLEESLSLSYDIGHRWHIARRLEDLACMLASSPRAEVAAKLLGASESLRQAFGFARTRREQAALTEARAAAGDRLGIAGFEGAWSKGTAMTTDEAVALALGRTAPTRAERPQRAGGLTAREVEIVLDIARGRTNRQIAERLGLSERTVDAHVQNVRNKLGMDKRAQIAAWASVHLPSASPASPVT